MLDILSTGAFWRRIQQLDISVFNYACNASRVSEQRVDRSVLHSIEKLDTLSSVARITISCVLNNGHYCEG